MLNYAISSENPRVGGSNPPSGTIYQATSMTYIAGDLREFIYIWCASSGKARNKQGWGHDKSSRYLDSDGGVHAKVNNFRIVATCVRARLSFIQTRYVALSLKRHIDQLLCLGINRTCFLNPNLTS